MRRFYSCARRADGLQNYCIRCAKQVGTIRYADHGDELRAYARVHTHQRYHSDPAYREALAVRSRRPEVRKRINQQQLDRYRRHQRRVTRYLRHHPCVDCGERNVLVLEFDHVCGRKTREISRMLCQTWTTIMAEIAKCEVRCGNCHRRRHARENCWGIERNNPTRNRYMHRVARFKQRRGCVECGETDPVILDLDHVRGNKIVEVSHLVGHSSWDVIKHELAKCEVRCHNCHQLRHKTERVVA